MKPNQKIDPRINSIVCGDCLEWLKNIPPKSIDMCYIDPPFFSNKNYEIIWGNGYELRSFKDRWKGGLRAYTEWIEEKAKLIHRCLKDTGSIFLHCDRRTNHYLKMMLDELFGEKNLINEIAWCYSNSGKPKNSFAHKHDTILFYAKTKSLYYWNNYKTPIPNKYLESHYRQTDSSGKRCRKRIDGGKERIYYPNEGMICNDWWTDIPSLNSQAKERVGYETQKPESLLERIISCSTREGYTVLDCFAGGGTTATVAAKLNRNFIVGDVSPVAVRVTSKRLRNLPDTPPFDVLNVPRTIDDWLAMNGHKFADEICKFMGWECNPKKSNDGGIDGWTTNQKNQRVPIQIKKSKAVGVNPIKNFFASLGKALEGIFVAHSFAKTAEEFRAQIKRDEKKNIKLISVEEILEDILIDDTEKEKLDELYRKYDKAA